MVIVRDFLQKKHGGRGKGWDIKESS
jgi:hypothetical protein